jgi:hypothetical protein
VAMAILFAVIVFVGFSPLHRRLGWVMSALAAYIVMLIAAAILEQLRRVSPEPPPPIALALSVFDIIVFSTLVSSAIYLRKRADWRKRLLLYATILNSPVCESCSDDQFTNVTSSLGCGGILIAIALTGPLVTKVPP